MSKRYDAELYDIVKNIGNFKIKGIKSTVNKRQML